MPTTHGFDGRYRKGLDDPGPDLYRQAVMAEMEAIIREAERTQRTD